MMKNEIILYRPDENAERIEVRIDAEKETVWLSQEQIARLLQRDQSVISRHIRNVFKEGELEEKSNMQKMHISNSDKPVTLYNLDVIISVGYRVKSKQGTQIRLPEFEGELKIDMVSAFFALSIQHDAIKGITHNQFWK